MDQASQLTCFVKLSHLLLATLMGSKESEDLTKNLQQVSVVASPFIHYTMAPAWRFMYIHMQCLEKIALILGHAHWLTGWHKTMRCWHNDMPATCNSSLIRTSTRLFKTCGMVLCNLRKHAGQNVRCIETKFGLITVHGAFLCDPEVNSHACTHHAFCC